MVKFYEWPEPCPIKKNLKIAQNRLTLSASSAILGVDYESKDFLRHDKLSRGLFLVALAVPSLFSGGAVDWRVITSLTVPLWSKSGRLLVRDFPAGRRPFFVPAARRPVPPSVARVILP
jgi:hypothetical protein